jgi:hypothetical protein
MLKTINNKIEALKDLYYALEQDEAKWGREWHDARGDLFYMMCDYYYIPISVMAEELGLSYQRSGTLPLFQMEKRCLTHL